MMMMITIMRRLLVATVCLLLLGVVLVVNGTDTSAATTTTTTSTSRRPSSPKITPSMALLEEMETTSELLHLDAKNHHHHHHKKGNKKHKPPKRRRVCTRNIPNVRGVLRPTCCNGATCGFAHGICCEGGSHCCPHGTICVQGDPATPPGCMHVLDKIMSQLGGVPSGGSPALHAATTHLPSAGAPASAIPIPLPGAKGCKIGSPGCVGAPTAPVAAAHHTSSSSHLDAELGAPLYLSPQEARNPYLSHNQPIVKKDPVHNLDCGGGTPPCAVGMKKVVYEDAMAPQGRNAFSQYRVYKTTKHHELMKKTGAFSQSFALKAKQRGPQQGPIPPSMKSLKLGDPEATGQTANAQAVITDPVSQRQLITNRDIDGTISINEKQGPNHYNSGSHGGGGGGGGHGGGSHNRDGSWNMPGYKGAGAPEDDINGVDLGTVSQKHADAIANAKAPASGLPKYRINGQDYEVNVQYSSSSPSRQIRSDHTKTYYTPSDKEAEPVPTPKDLLG